MGLWVDRCSDSARFCWVVCSRGPTGSLGGSASCPSRPPWTSVLAAIALLMVLAKAQLARGAHEVPERSRLELARCCLCSIPLAKGRHLVKSKVKGRTLCFILDTPSVHTGVLTE